MSEYDFVYGVFDRCETAAGVVEHLHGAGFRPASINLVGPDTKAFQYVSAKIKDPSKRFFVLFGAIGALGGLWAGAMLAPGLPYVVSFQILTTLMGSISGAIVMAYFSLFISAFLTANDPQFYANVYQADMQAGAALVSVAAESEAERQLAQRLIEEAKPIELIVRRAVVGPIIGLEPGPELVREPAVISEARETALSAVA